MLKTYVIPYVYYCNDEPSEIGIYLGNVNAIDKEDALKVLTNQIREQERQKLIDMGDDEDDPIPSIWANDGKGRDFLDESDEEGFILGEPIELKMLPNII